MKNNEMEKAERGREITERVKTAWLRKASTTNRLSHSTIYLMEQRHLRSTNIFGSWMLLRSPLSLKPRKRTSVCVCRVRDSLCTVRLTEALLKCILVLTASSRYSPHWRRRFWSYLTFTARSCLVMAEATRQFFMLLQLLEESRCLQSEIY